MDNKKEPFFVMQTKVKLRDWHENENFFNIEKYLFIETLKKVVFPGPPKGTFQGGKNNHFEKSRSIFVQLHDGHDHL